MPALTINGKPLEVPPGTNLIEAARLAGAEVPHFCYHPGLSVAGNCRMCLVEIAGNPKLQIACNTPAAEGQAVLTESPKVKAARAGVMEFLLLNHPIDCPVCDCAGECFLQDHYMRHDLAASRLEEPKNKKRKAQDIGPHVMLDTERCVLCSRCVRFTDEVSKTHELGIFGRGSREEVGLVEGTRLANAYSGNVVDLCPVGALTDKNFRFKSRPWFLEETETICTGCSQGCNMVLDINPHPFNKVGTGRAYRSYPRFNPAVNGHWMCDEGRYRFPIIDEGRFAEPLVAGLAATPERAVAALAAGLKAAGAPVTFLLSPGLSIEELATWQWLSGKLGASAILASELIPLGKGDGFLIQGEKSPNRKGGLLLGLPEKGAQAAASLAREGKGRLVAVATGDLEPALEAACLALLTTHSSPACASAAVALPLAVWAEQDGAFINRLGLAQRANRALAPMGSALPAWDWAWRLARELGFQADYAARASDIFAAVSAAHPALAGLSYQALGSQGAQVREGK
jgi:NADH-quinone oxidoreductase subunit G